MKIVVIGGTGLIGAKVVAKLTEHGHEAVPASPRLGINTITGEGLAAALDGASVVVDVSNSPNFEYATALDFFETSTRNLLAAAREAGVGHVVALSVVGTRDLSEGGDPTKTTAGYFLAEGLPGSHDQGVVDPVHDRPRHPVLRVHQEHCGRLHRRRGGPRADRSSSSRSRPTTSPRRWPAVAAGAPVNGIVEIGGPEQFRFEEPVRRVLAAADDPREVVSDRQRRLLRDHRCRAHARAGRRGDAGRDPPRRLAAGGGCRTREGGRGIGRGALDRPRLARGRRAALSFVGGLPEPRTLDAARIDAGSRMAEATCWSDGHTRDRIDGRGGVAQW